ncbi:hypothetical protein N0V82_006603 [Gnomoniopsis sp. IMI 355080]|nr:hypothetical protein N0V82_006603 [Gnomoniopsis sp. IMI 355080]
MPHLPRVTWLCLVHLASSQTIVIDNTTESANVSTVAAAAAVVNNSNHLPAETLQLTDAVIANLTSLSLTNISLFDFGDSSSTAPKRAAAAECKTFPGDSGWPADLTWDVLNLMTGEALIKTVPLASPCYDDWGKYDVDECAYVTNQWTNSSLHYDDPTSVMSPIFEGLTCIPSSQSGTCTLGGYPSYAVNISNVAQVQLAVNYARNLNLRLVVKNTGHDFCGRSSGAGALSIWTHHLKDLEFIETYTTQNYSGPAIKGGSGVQGFELYEFADANGVVAVGGEGKTVGWGGGYIAGGGHSPLSSVYGMAADQVLSVDIVTPDGRFVTANETQNTDLFWALRGGGGSTLGVVTSWTVKVYPDFPIVSYMTMTLAATGNVTMDMFWAAMKEYLLFLPTTVDAGNYHYFYMMTPDDYPQLLFVPWLAPGMTVAELKNLTAPLLDAWAQLGISISPEYFQYDSFLPAWTNGFTLETVGMNTTKQGSRLIPRETFTNETQFDSFFSAVKQVYDLGGQFVGVVTTGAPAGIDVPDNAVNPPWRDTVLHLLAFRSWDANTTWSKYASYSDVFTNEWMPILKNATPGSGSYDSEGDVNEPDFKQSFYGLENYDRLLEIKEKYDPEGLFYANKGVGSDAWYVTDQLAGLPTQNGRLCRISS